MRTIIPGILVLLLLAGPGWAQSTGGGSSPPPASAPDDPARLRQEIEQLKQVIRNLEERLDRQEKAQAPKEQSQTEPLSVAVEELEKRLSEAEKHGALDRVRLTGDYRFEAHTIWGRVPSHFDGMGLQNLVVKTMFAMPILGRPPSSVAEINNTVAANYADYLQFTNSLTFDQLKQAMGSFPPAMQQQLFGMLLPAVQVNSYKDNNRILYTNRVRLNFDAKVADNVSFTGRLSMYKVFGDSTGVQVFNGQPNTLNIDGTTSGVPNSDQVRIERAYFSWNDIGGSKLYLSIGRRPSTYGPPMNFRQDELRGGTPSGALIDYQFDGITFGYKFNDNMVWRLCYGLGYESGFGNANLLKMPQDRLKDVHFLGANIDFWTSEKTLFQATFAHAFDVTDGFNGLIVMPRNPLTGDPIAGAPVLRFTPSTNLGSINLFGINLTRRQGPVDFYFSGNYSGTQPNGMTTPFGGLMSDPFENPANRNGYMLLAGLRYSFPNDERTKLGFEFNHGSKYWFNFAQGADDIIAPKTNTRGQVYETYFTHRINDRFLFKMDFIKYVYDYSGSGWHLGAPKKLDENPILGFPTYDDAFKVSMGLIARF